ncbi:acetylxylan esterase [Ructibacterium gallinarum]|uniref:Acetylxylan esterase n=1 Tax=Ructibacterium gallinarum TaxID=2779355 RepID=A0A9D5M4B5_9FIRM|nr:acetylxylan esterase [Ructibacterium gallinarum]MBE5040454.1 acetylxylan esterase [Ructibacterium gallinarum]
MPILDMPVEELKNYKGRNPRPADFEEYWGRALAEMEALNVEVEITRSSFQLPNVECFDMYFTGTRGGRVYAKLLKPATIREKAPAALYFHGYSASVGDWMNYMGYINMGFVVAAMDARGQGGKSIDKNPVEGNTLNGHIIRGLDDPDPDNMYFRQVFLDTALLAKIVMNLEEVDEERVVAFGGSQGGALTVACAALTPQLKMAAPYYPFLSDYKRVWEMDMAERAYGELKDYFRRFDPRHEREEEVFTRLGYIDLQHLAPRIQAKILFGTGLMDNVCPPSTQFAIYNKIVSEKKMVLYPDFGHENLPDFDDMTAAFFAQML